MSAKNRPKPPGVKIRRTLLGLSPMTRNVWFLPRGRCGSCRAERTPSRPAPGSMSRLPTRIRIARSARRRSRPRGRACGGAGRFPPDQGCRRSTSNRRLPRSTEWFCRNYPGSAKGVFNFTPLRGLRCKFGKSTAFWHRRAFADDVWRGRGGLRRLAAERWRVTPDADHSAARDRAKCTCRRRVSQRQCRGSFFCAE